MNENEMAARELLFSGTAHVEHVDPFEEAEQEYTAEELIAAARKAQEQRIAKRAKQASKSSNRKEATMSESIDRRIMREEPDPVKQELEKAAADKTCDPVARLAADWDEEQDETLESGTYMCRLFWHKYYSASTWADGSFKAASIGLGFKAFGSDGEEIDEPIWHYLNGHTKAARRAALITLAAIFPDKTRAEITAAAAPLSGSNPNRIDMKRVLSMLEERIEGKPDDTRLTSPEPIYVRAAVDVKPGAKPRFTEIVAG
jgi:hypothetical protein